VFLLFPLEKVFKKLTKSHIMNKKEIGITLAVVVVGGLIVYGLVYAAQKLMNKKKDADQDQTTATLKVVTDAA
jgi:membrane protein YqaA with SNARE-associated domain